MVRKAKKRKPTEPKITNRQRLFVDYLPEHNWDFVKAGLAAGFSRYYATKRLHSIVKSNVGLSRLIETKRVEISAGSQDIREEATTALIKIMRNPDTTNGELIKCIDGLGKMNGWQSQTIKMESSNRQHELDSAARIEASRLADLRCGLLTGSVAMAKQVDSVTGDIAGHGDIIDGDIISVTDKPIDGDIGHGDIDIASQPDQLPSRTNVQLDHVPLDDPIAPQKVDGPQYPS